MNKVLLGAIVLLVVVGGYLLIGGKKNTTPTGEQSTTGTSQPNVANEEMVTIKATAAGFAPNAVTVKAGTRVVWVNESGKAITVNSAVHPTHQVYPPLNLGEFQNGSSVQLVFNDKGTYFYHNHLDSTQTGKVVVE